MNKNLRRDGAEFKAILDCHGVFKKGDRMKMLVYSEGVSRIVNLTRGNTTSFLSAHIEEYFGFPEPLGHPLTKIFK